MMKLKEFTWREGGWTMTPSLLVNDAILSRGFFATTAAGKKFGRDVRNLKDGGLNGNEMRLDPARVIPTDEDPEVFPVHLSPVAFVASDGTLIRAVLVGEGDTVRAFLLLGSQAPFVEACDVCRIRDTGTLDCYIRRSSSSVGGSTAHYDDIACMVAPFVPSDAIVEARLAAVLELSSALLHG